MLSRAAFYGKMIFFIRHVFLLRKKVKNTLILHKKGTEKWNLKQVY